MTLTLETPAALPGLTGDRALLFEALANLLSNSIKFTPPGGEVILRVCLLPSVLLLLSYSPFSTW